MLPWAIMAYASGESVSVGDVQHAINRVLESPMTREEFNAWIEDQEDGVMGAEEHWKKTL
jgi:hypothetical protein